MNEGMMNKSPFRTLPYSNAGDTSKINAEILRLEMMYTAIQWLERLNGNEVFQTIRSWLCDSVREAREEFENNTTITKANGDRINQPNKSEAQRFRSYAFRLAHIYGAYWDAINDAIQGGDTILSELLERLKSVHDDLKTNTELTETLVSKREKTKKKQRNAGKKAFKETRKPAVDKARADKEYAFKLCRKIIKENDMSYKGVFFSKADAVFNHVIDHFYEMKTDGELTGCLRSSNGRKFKASSFRHDYYEYYKGKE